MPRRNRPVPRCRRCRLERLPDESFQGGFCPACHLDYAKKKRQAKTTKKLLARAKGGGTEQRDGQKFHVVALPPQRRRGR